MTVQVLTDYTSGVWELIENVVLNQSCNYLVVILAWSATTAGSPPWRELSLPLGRVWINPLLLF
jgi:hypothetical protein